MTKHKLSLRDICMTALFAAGMAVCAMVAIPVGPGGVPITLQTFAVALAGIVLGARRGVLAAIVYIALGAVGAPVFVGFSGGFGVLAGPTGGFILSFPLMAAAAGIGSRSGIAKTELEAKGTRPKARLAAGLFVGAGINYLCGALWYSLVTRNGLGAAIVNCVLPFVPADTVKFAVAAVVGRRLRKL